MPFIEANQMLTGAPLSGWSGRFFHSENMTFAHWDISADASDLHEHHHPQEEVWNIVEGEVVIVLAGDELRLGPGDAAIFPPDTPHAVKVTGPCRAVIVDHPLRPNLPGLRSSAPTPEG